MAYLSFLPLTVSLETSPPMPLEHEHIGHAIDDTRRLALRSLGMSITYSMCENSIDKGAAELKPATCHQEPRIFELDPIKDPRWKAFTDLHPDATVFHRVEWLQALKDCYGYEPRVISLTPPGSRLQSGLVFCQICSALTGNRIVSLPFSDHCEPLVGSLGDFDLLLNNLKEKVGGNRWNYVEIRPLVHGPVSRSEFATRISYYLHRLDLRCSEELLFKSFHKDSVQRKIRRAERERLRYEEGCSEKLLDYFYKLLILTRRRQGLPPQPRKWFENLIAQFGQKSKIRVAFKADRPIGSILTISDKKAMVYKYGCSDAWLHKLGGMAWLFWTTIQEAKAQGLEELDMGRSDMHNPGLVTWKERWGAKRTTVNYWRYPADTVASWPEGALKPLKRLISLAPDKSLVMLGNLLYRHIG